MSTDHVFDVIVIGAGISGLSGAKLLTENGINLLVLEAQDRVGGRTWTVKNSNVGWVDLGGAYIGRGQNRVLRMIKEFGLKLYTVNEKEKLVHYDANKEKRSLFHHNEFPNIDLLALLDVNHILRLLDKMSETIPSGEPWNALKAEEWDQMTFREFVHQNTISKYAREIIANIVQTSNTSEPYETSLLAFLSGIKEAGGVRPLLSTTNGAQEFKVLGGTNQICERLVECVGTSRVLLKHPVYSLKQHGDSVVVRTLNGKEFRCKFVINATPPAVQQKIHYQPPLPPIRNQLIQRTPMGSVFKCVIYYEKLFWRPKDMCGSLVILGSDDQHPITFTVDDTKPDGSFPAIVGFIPANKARKLVDLSKKERLYLICESLAKAFDCEEARKPIHYEEYNWMENQYCGGGYCMNCPPGFITRYGRYIAQPFGQMYFAGTEVASEWSGYIDGAIQAGERAARQIMALKGLISEDEIDQKESESIDYCLVPFVSSTLERYAPSAKEFLCGTVIVIFMLVLAMVARIYG